MLNHAKKRKEKGIPSLDHFSSDESDWRTRMTENKKGGEQRAKSELFDDSVGFPMTCQSSVEIVVLAKV